MRCLWDIGIYIAKQVWSFMKFLKEILKFPFKNRYYVVLIRCLHINQIAGSKFNVSNIEHLYLIADCHTTSKNPFVLSSESEICKDISVNDQSSNALNSIVLFNPKTI